MSYLVFPVHLSLCCTFLDMNHICLPFVILGKSLSALHFKELSLCRSHKGDTVLPKQPSELNSS